MKGIHVTSELDAELASSDPLGWPGYRDSLDRAGTRSGRKESVHVAEVLVDANPAVLVEFDFRFLGGSLGEATGDKVVRAFEHARRRQVPVISVVASGGARMQEGMRSLLQLQRIAAAAGQARADGIPHIAILRPPTTGGVWVALASTADVVLALPGAEVSFAGSRVRDEDAGDAARAFTAEGKLAAGFVDALESEFTLDSTLGRAVALLSPRSRGIPSAPDVPRALGDLRPSSDGWDSVQRARDPRRPQARAYVDDYFESRLELSGDRAGGTDPGMLIGVGRRHGRSIAYAAQAGTATTPAGFRAAARLVRLADALGLPLLTLIDTPGAANDAAAEHAGVGTAIGELLDAVAACRPPVTSLVIGEGGSGGALALASHEHLWITPDAYFSVTAPEGATAILKRDPSEVARVACDLRVSPAELLALGVVAGIAGAEPVPLDAPPPADFGRLSSAASGGLEMTPTDQARRLYEEAETQAAQATEQLVSSQGFGGLLALMTENVVALTRVGSEMFDLGLRNLRLAGRQDVAHLGRQIGRTEDKLEMVLQEVERIGQRLDEKAVTP